MYSKTMQDCPVCDSSLTEQPQCPRCGSDLSLLQTIQMQSRQHLIAALQFSIKGDQIRANQQLQSARQLNNDQLTVSIERILSPDTTRQYSPLEVITSSIKQWGAGILKLIGEAGLRVVAKCFKT
jgi:hypothetical protein